MIKRDPLQEIFASVFAPRPKRKPRKRIREIEERKESIHTCPVDGCYLTIKNFPDKCISSLSWSLKHWNWELDQNDSDLQPKRDSIFNVRIAETEAKLAAHIKAKEEMIKIENNT